MWSLDQKAMVRALAWVSGDENCATNACAAASRPHAPLDGTDRVPGNTSSPPPCEVMPRRDRTQRGEFFGHFTELVIAVFRRRRPRGRRFGYLVRFDHSHLPDGKAAIAARVAADVGPAHRFAGRSAGWSFYSFSIGNWKHRTKRPRRSTAGSRGGPTKCRQFSRQIVDVVALPMRRPRTLFPVALYVLKAR